MSSTMFRLPTLALVFVLSHLWFCLVAFGQDNDLANPKTVKVFILAGQSNMQGHGVVDLDHKDHYNAGRGTLAKLFDNRSKARMLGHLRDTDGNWIRRDDVMVSYKTKHGLKKGPLTIGFSGHEGNHHIGPELQFGHVIGDLVEDPVVLIKTAWGGKSLGVDFLPPSAAKRDAAETGLFYKQMMHEVNEAITTLDQKFPELANCEIEIAGFVWQQGWNDMYDDKCRDNYEANLACLIKDVRSAWEKPNLPVVVGELGNGGKDANEKMMEIRNAQRAVAIREEFRGNVAFAPTAAAARPAKDSPNTGHGHHWFGNAESYFLIGDSLGKAMTAMLDSRPRVLILGDSISMGYTPLVKAAMNEQAYVTRPNTNCAGTTKGIAEIDRWLEIDGGKWDVIHFNFGLHDLKRVQPGTLKNSNDPTHENQAPIATYEKQLREIVGKLKKTGAKLVFATTTPVPKGGVEPHRDVTGPNEYNEIALKIMNENDIAVNDLFAFAAPIEEEIMKPVDVHFKPGGSKKLAEKVVEAISKEIKK